LSDFIDFFSAWVQDDRGLSPVLIITATETPALAAKLEFEARLELDADTLVVNAKETVLRPERVIARAYRASEELLRKRSVCVSVLSFC